MRRRTAATAIVGFLCLVAACDQGDEGAEVGEPLTSDSTATTQPADASTTAATRAAKVIEVAVVRGRVEGGVRRERVTVGDDVVLRVTSDAADEVHVHGYDLTADVSAGQVAEISFEASIPGVFEVELEKMGREILQLEVSP